MRILIQRGLVSNMRKAGGSSPGEDFQLSEAEAVVAALGVVVHLQRAPSMDQLYQGK